MTCTHWHSGEFTPHHLCWLFDRYSHISYRNWYFFTLGSVRNVMEWHVENCNYK